MLFKVCPGIPSLSGDFAVVAKTTKAETGRVCECQSILDGKDLVFP